MNAGAPRHGATTWQSRAAAWGRAALVAAMLCCLAAPGQAANVREDEDAPSSSGPDGRYERIAAIAVDVAVVRLLAISQLAVCATYFVAMSPLSLVTWRIDESYHNWVELPFDYAFRRELGRL